MNIHDPAIETQEDVIRPSQAEAEAAVQTLLRWAGGEKAISAAEGTIPSGKVSTRSNKKRPGSKHGGKKKAQFKALDLEEKIFIADREIRNRKKKVTEINDAYEKDAVNFEAMIGETSDRITEIKREAYEFKRDVLKSGLNPRSGKIKAESVIKYFEDKINQKNKIVEKLSDKNMRLTAQMKKMEKQLSRGEQSGESLNPIDFHQLEIENKTYSQRIDAKNKALVKLKTSTAKMGQILTDKKAELVSLTDESTRLRKRIKDALGLEKNVTQELKNTKNSIARMRKQVEKLRLASSSASDMPQVVDYVNQKQEEFELRKKIKQWEKKVQLMSTAARRARAEAKGLGATRNRKGRKALMS